jgi:hypothetical protein
VLCCSAARGVGLVAHVRQNRNAGGEQYDKDAGAHQDDSEDGGYGPPWLLLAVRRVKGARVLASYCRSPDPVSGAEYVAAAKERIRQRN